MAHPIHIKGEALALLLTGESTRAVARKLGVPRRTVRRWEVEAWALLRACIPAEVRAEIRAALGR